MLEKITVVMLAIWLSQKWYNGISLIAIFNRTKWLKIRFWKLKFWQLSKRLDYARFQENFQSSVVGIIIINNNDNMKPSRISLLFNYLIFNCCYLHGVGRIIILTVELRHFFFKRSS